VGTTAPYYNGFADSGGDSCPDSASIYYATPCSVDRRFSIAVR
jgi:hypothetical protein